MGDLSYFYLFNIEASYTKLINVVANLLITSTLIMGWLYKLYSLFNGVCVSLEDISTGVAKF